LRLRSLLTIDPYDLLRPPPTVTVHPAAFTVGATQAAPAPVAPAATPTFAVRHDAVPVVDLLGLDEPPPTQTTGQVPAAAPKAYTQWATAAEVSRGIPTTDDGLPIIDASTPMEYIRRVENLDIALLPDLQRSTGAQHFPSPYAVPWQLRVQYYSVVPPLETIPARYAAPCSDRYSICRSLLSPSIGDLKRVFQGSPPEVGG